jgi:tryptophan synthase alpha chain
LPEDIRQRLTLVKKLSSQPVAVGFGISKPEHVELLSPYADALVVGSALVRLIEEDAKSSPQAIKNFLRTLKGSQ